MPPSHPTQHRRWLAALVFAVTLPWLASCQSAYYKTMETFGRHKRDILVDRVVDARDSQVEAKEQFQTALDRFRDVARFDGGFLEDRYRDLKAELNRSEKRADEVHERINAVAEVAEDLFEEWEGELDLYTSADLRTASERQLRETRRRYERLMRAMRDAESRIEPVLQPLRDQVLFLKHNLNARAIAALDEELVTVQADVDALVREMERSISEADAFLKTLPRG